MDVMQYLAVPDYPVGYLKSGNILNLAQKNPANLQYLTATKQDRHRICRFAGHLVLLLSISSTMMADTEER